MARLSVAPELQWCGQGSGPALQMWEGLDLIPEDKEFYAYLRPGKRALGSPSKGRNPILPTGSQSMLGHWCSGKTPGAGFGQASVLILALSLTV